MASISVSLNCSRDWLEVKADNIGVTMEQVSPLAAKVYGDLAIENWSLWQDYDYKLGHLSARRALSVLSNKD